MKKSAFTLMELIVVIFIIGIISGAVTVSYKVIREKSRDARRLSDLAQVQNALELYFRDEGSYPNSLTPGQSLVGTTTGISYLTTIPENPRPRNDGNCPDNEYSYTLNGQTTYTINFCLGHNTDSLNTGSHCATPRGIENQACQ